MLRTASVLRQYQLETIDGYAAPVVDLMVDDRSWRIAHVVIKTGRWLSTRRVLVECAALRGADHPRRRLMTDLTHEELRAPVRAEHGEPAASCQDAGELDEQALAGYWERLTALVPYSLPDDAPLLIEEARIRAWSDRTRRDPHLQRLSAVVGYRVRAIDGPAGRLADVVIDPQQWSIRGLIMDNGSLITAQRIDDVRPADRTFRLSLTREELTDAPRVRAGAAEQPADLERQLQHASTPAHSMSRSVDV